MLTSHAFVATAHAQKYLVQLSKHWAHKFDTLTYTEERVEIPFPAGPCTLSATTSGLNITLRSDSSEALARMQLAVADHLKRFAHREDLVVTWSEEEVQAPTAA